MASSAGLRSIKLVIPFQDEFGSLGSNLTAASAQKKVVNRLFTQKEESLAFTDLIQSRCVHETMDFITTSSTHNTMTDARQRFYDTCNRSSSRFAGIDRSVVEILAFYSPYFMTYHGMPMPMPDAPPIPAVGSLSLRQQTLFWARVECSQIAPDGVRIHTRRLFERIQEIAQEVREEYVDLSPYLTETPHLASAVERKMGTFTKLLKSMDPATMRLVAEGVAMMIYYSIHL